MTNADPILVLETRRVAAMLEGDIPALASLLSPSIAWIHSSGVQDSRERLLQRIEAGQLKYFSIESTGVKTRHDGNLATVTGRNEIVAELSGNRLTSMNLYVGIWANEAGSWQMIHLQSTGVKV